MVLAEPVVVGAGGDLSALPQSAAVYLIWPREGTPYLGRTSLLRRRMMRLWEKWRLGETAERIEYWPAASRLELWLVSYELGRRYFPDDYQRLLRLPKPAYVRLVLGNRFPRTMITTRVGGGRSLYFGPFASRANADQFEGQFLDLFQLRRCQEDLIPAPDHPGCIYGEMNMCLRPCQEAVTDEEYGSEAARVGEFLRGRGAGLMESTRAARERFSEEMEFEEAARQHVRLEKIQEIVKLPGELAREVSGLHGVAVTRSGEPESVRLWFLREGCWLNPRTLDLSMDQTVSMDGRLKEVTGGLEAPETKLRADHLALLAKWFYSSWRDGEWLGFEDPATLSYRKLVNAIHRVAKG
jgi:excinuclease ABC subunit C